MITFHDLTDSTDDIATLTRFYETLYVGEFPDPDERESLANMIDYLGRRARGWYGRNNYHVLLAAGADGRPVGASIVDYLAEPNVGVIEFLLVAPEARRFGVGRQVLARTEQLLAEDACRPDGEPLAAIVAEMNDPLAPSGVRDNLDPATRALVWARWGYAGLDFPYVQPALSAEQVSVTNLIVIAKPLRPDWAAGLPATTVGLVVREYLRWAMRIDQPDTCADYRRMAEHLAARDTVATLPLAGYVGHDPDRPLDVREITDADDLDFAPTMARYREAFGGGGLAVPETDFRRALAGADYHLWALRGTDDGQVEGLASFFSLPGAGFGGYLALAGSLRGTGRLRPLVARIEQRMLRDRPAARGWYIEVGPATDPGPFRAIGFREVEVDYRVPPNVPVRLLYKPFGRCYDPPELAAGDVLGAVEEILVTAYGVAEPRAHPTFRLVAGGLADPVPLG